MTQAMWDEAVRVNSQAWTLRALIDIAESKGLHRAAKIHRVQLAILEAQGPIEPPVDLATVEVSDGEAE